MGTFGPGPFDNDTALDFAAEASNWEVLQSVFKRINEILQTGDDIDADDAQTAIAAAEIVATGMGRGLSDTPQHISPNLLTSPDDTLVEQAQSAVSAVLMGSELLDLWAEDDASSFNESMHDLMRRLNPEVPFDPKPWAENDPIPKNAQCCICGELIEQAMVELTLRLRHDGFNDATRYLTAHTLCMNKVLHPRHFVQDWTFKI